MLGFSLVVHAFLLFKHFPTAFCGPSPRYDEEQNIVERARSSANDNPNVQNGLNRPATSSFPNIYWPLSLPAPITIPGQESNDSLTANLTAAPKISCDGRLYGRNLPLNSCRQVYRLMSSAPIPKTYGQRGTGNFDAPLPFRYLSYDGLCAIDLSHASGIDFDTMLPVEIKEAAGLLIQICVSGEPNIGGVATGLGVNKGLALRITRYRPTVTCGPEGSGAPWRSCRDVLDHMPTGNRREVFGPNDLPNTTVPLPWFFQTSEKRCELRVQPRTASDVSDWYKIWAAGNAIDYMCTHFGKSGIAVGIGERKTLQVELLDMTPDALGTNGSVETA